MEVSKKKFEVFNQENWDWAKRGNIRHSSVQRIDKDHDYLLKGKKVDFKKIYNNKR